MIAPPPRTRRVATPLRAPRSEAHLEAGLCPRSGRRTRGRVGAIACALALLAAPLRAGASGAADEADLQFQIAAEHYAKGEFRDALEHFLASNRLVPNKNVVFNIARTYEKLGRLADAHRYYTDALVEETAPKKIGDINDAIRRIAPGVAVLRVETDPPGATIYIDRKDLGARGVAPRALALPPGGYTVIAEIDGYELATSGVLETKLGSETVVPLKLRRIVGTVQVGVEGAPDAAVHVDDEKAPPICQAPCTFDVPPGRHLLYFTRDGFQAAPRQVNVTAKDTVRATAQLTPFTGVVVVRADERDAVVEIDGRPMGFTPAVIQNVAVGTRKVRVLLRGYAPIERVIEVKTGEQTELTDLALTPLRQVAAVSRYAESIDDAPSSVTIIDGQELRAFGYPTIAEALRGTRGFSINNDGAYYSVAVRGIGQPNDYGNRVLVLSDGASLNDDLLSSSYIGSDGRDDLHDVARIEVVRGPGSLLYGTGAFSGLVNLVPREKDDADGVHGAVGTYNNSVGRGRLGVHYNFTPKIGVTASLTGARSDGTDLPLTLTTAGATTGVITAHDVDYFRAWGTQGRFWADWLTAQWFFHTREQHIPTGANAVAVNDLRQEYVDTRWLAEIRAEPKLGDQVELLVRFHADRYTFHGEYPYDNPPQTPSLEDYYGTWGGLEARVAYTPIKQIRLTLGGEAQYHPQVEMVGHNGTAEGFVPGGATCPGPACYLNLSAPYGFGAGYLLFESTPATWVHLSAGVRIDDYPATYASTLQAPRSSTPSTDIGTIPVPRAAVIFKPWSGGVIKLLFGRAFRAPSVYEEFYSDGGRTSLPGNDPKRNTKLAPESVYTGEVELSQRFATDWVALAAGHGSYVTGLIDTNTIAKPGGAPGTTVDTYANSSFPALAIGADIEFRREWRQGWMLSAYYSYEHAAYVDYRNIANPQLVDAPQHLAAFKGVVPVLPDLLSLATRITLEAPRRISATTNEETPTAVVADLIASGNLKRFGVGYMLGMYNVIDSRYVYPVTPGFATSVMQQPGRTFVGDISVTWP
jgi:outer membrane receptor protein involved in Fe transport